MRISRVKLLFWLAFQFVPFGLLVIVFWVLNEGQSRLFFVCLLFVIVVWNVAYFVVYRRRNSLPLKRSKAGLCRRCEYDLRATKVEGTYTTCPDCGLMQAITYKSE